MSKCEFFLVCGDPKSFTCHNAGGSFCGKYRRRKQVTIPE
jgi:hypothetical protein